MFWYVFEDYFSGSLLFCSIAFHNGESDGIFSREAILIILDCITLYWSTTFSEIIHKFRNCPFFWLTCRAIYMDPCWSIFRILVNLERNSDTFLFWLEDNFFCEDSCVILFLVFKSIAHSDSIALFFNEFVFDLFSEFLKFSIIIKIPFYIFEVISISVNLYICCIKPYNRREAHIDI